MKIFCVLSNVPDRDGEAIEVVGREVVRHMAALGHEVAVQVLIREGWSADIEKRASEAARELSRPGSLEILPTIYLGDLLREQDARPGGLRAPGRLRGLGRAGAAADRLFSALRSLPLLRRWPNPRFFPALAARPTLRSVIETTRPDVLLSIWSWEALAATFDLPGVPKFVYYGNPDHKPEQARMRFPELFDLPHVGVRGALRQWILRLENRAREIQHLRMMRCCEVTANNSAVDARYYEEQGHPRSIYLQNMWPEDPGGPVMGGRPDRDGPVRVAGSVGNLAATGNTFGLRYLGERLAPELESRIGADRLRIDVYGGGSARPRVASALDRPAIHLRGWVDDLSEELRRSHVFLVLTNVDGFIVGNTRILLAWSLGTCVVAHSNTALSMPEIRHMQNALLGDSPEEIADLVARAARDDDLRARIGRGGYEAFRDCYVSDGVVPKMLTAMEACIAGSEAETC